jgi:hypothetical protein
MADGERPSPFTIPEPTFKFAEGLPSEPRPSRSMTVGGLIHNLSVFADFYERAGADIERKQGVTKPWYIGNRDANADVVQRDFRATVAIDRVRAYVLAKYGAGLTIGTARRLLGDLIKTCGLAVDAAEALPLEEAMDKLDGVESRGNDASNILESKGTPARDEKYVVPPQSLRTPAQLLEAFASAAAKFPACPRMVAFLNSAREDGLVTVPSSFVPRKADGQPVIGELNIGGTSKTVFGPQATIYGIGGARMASEHGCLNVGFVLYGAGNDEAATKFRELGNEAGVVVHVHDLVRGIQTYDRPLVLWSLIVYETLQGSAWLSQIDGITENPALHFNPFAASVETLKRLLARNESLIERLLAGPDDVELSPRDLALLEAHLRQPVSFATIQQEKKATGHSPTEAARNKLKLIRDFNQRLQGQGDADEAEKREAPAPVVAPVPSPKRSTERGEGRAKLIAALTKHHKYADGGCLNLDPIGNNELAKAAGVSGSTASAFFNDKFQGHKKYKALCRNTGMLAAALKLLNDEFAPYLLLDPASSDLAAPEQDDADSES